MKTNPGPWSSLNACRLWHAASPSLMKLLGMERWSDKKRWSVENPFNSVSSGLWVQVSIPNHHCCDYLLTCNFSDCPCGTPSKLHIKPVSLSLGNSSDLYPLIILKGCPTLVILLLDFSNGWFPRYPPPSYEGTWEKTNQRWMSGSQHRGWCQRPFGKSLWPNGWDGHWGVDWGTRWVGHSKMMTNSASWKSKNLRTCFY